MSVRYVRSNLHLARLFARSRKEKCGTGMKRNMIASCKRRDDLLAEYITLTECNHYREECLNSKRGENWDYPVSLALSQRRQHEQKERNRQVS